MLLSQQERELSICRDVTFRRLSGFQDPAITPEKWDRLRRSGRATSVFQTYEWNRAWWDSYGRGDLLLVAAERDGEILALAPLFNQDGILYFVGSGGSDYLNFIGDISPPGILEKLLTTARDAVPNFSGFLFYHVLDDSATSELLRAAADQLALRWCKEDEYAAPLLEMSVNPEAAVQATNKKSLVRHERAFAKEGVLRVDHLVSTEAIHQHLPDLFDQHSRRWAATPTPSLFAQEQHRAFYRRLVQVAGHTGWLRFTRVEWEGRCIACHFGFFHDGVYLWYKPAFDPDLARRSPGEVLLRQLLLDALEQGARIFDFGMGEEAFKMRFATRIAHLTSWRLYCPKP